MSPGLEPEGEGRKCADTGDGCERSMTGGYTMDRRLMCVLLLGSRFRLRSDARSGSSMPRLKLWSAADEAEGPVL